MSGISTGGTPLILASPAPSTGGGGGGVTSLNGLIGAVTFTSGANITFTPSGNGFIISATGGGGTIGGTTTSPFVPYTASADTLADSLFSYGVSSGVPSLNATFTDTDPYIVSLGADAAISSAPGFSIQDLTTLYTLYGNVIPGGSAFVGLEDLGTDAGINFNLVSDVPSLNLTDGTSPYSISIVGGVLQIGGPSNNILVDENGNTTINDNLNLANATITDSAASVGTSGQFLSSTGTGVEWVAGGGAPGGTPTQLQFNNTVFGGVAGSAVNASTGEIDLAPPVTGFALSLTGAPDFTTALNVNSVGIGIQITSTAGSDSIIAVNSAGGVGINIGVMDVDNTNGAVGMYSAVQEIDSTGSGLTVLGLNFIGNLAGTNVDGDILMGSLIVVNDTSTGGAATEISGKTIQAAGNGTTTVLATGVHLRRIQGAISNYAILIDPQLGTPAVSTDPGDPSFFGSLFIGGTAGSQPTTAVSWTSGAGAPSGTPVTGSVYSNTTGAAGSSFYVFNGTAWFAVA